MSRGESMWLHRESPVRRGRQHGESGLTLLETTLGLSLIATLALAATGLVVPLARHGRLNREVAVATAGVKEHIERIRSLPFAEVATTFPDGATFSLPGLDAGRLEVVHEESGSDFLKLRLELRWTGEHGEMRRSISTARVR